MLDGLVPEGFFPDRTSHGKIKYDTNIMAEVPRSFRFEFFSELESRPVLLKNNPPRWEETRQCYVLNFFGRAVKASAKNFQLVDEEDEEEIIYNHGKSESGRYNVDYRAPVNPVQAFAISLAALGNKRAVG